MVLSRVMTSKAGDPAMLVVIDGAEYTIARADKSRLNTSDKTETELDRQAGRTLDNVSITMDRDGDYIVNAGRDKRGRR